MNSTVWVLIVFLGTSPWPGATSNHQIPEEYGTREACERGRIALRITNQVYAKNTASQGDYRIDHSVCVQVPVPAKPKAVKK